MSRIEFKQDINEGEDLKKIFCLFFTFIFVFSLPPKVQAEEASAPFDLTAKAYALAEIDTGRLIASKNAEICLPMASTTKIMTAFVAIRSNRLNDEITVTEEDVKVEGSSLSLRAGDVMKLSDMVRGMMAVSGNDAAKTIARFLGGSDENFAAMMNETAKELGMENTNFKNPHGLPDDEHFTTASDMVKLTSAALKEPLFLDIVSSYKTEITYINSVLGYSVRRLTNSNKLLNLVDGCIGVKTGYTVKSGRCLVSAVRREGAGVICVVLNSPDYYNDSQTLLEYGMTKVMFGDIITDTVEYELNVVGGIKTAVRVQNTKYLSGSMLISDYESMKKEIVLPKFVYAPIKAGDEVGRIQIEFEDGAQVSVPIVAMESVEKINYAEALRRNLFETLTANIKWIFT